MAALALLLVTFMAGASLVPRDAARAEAGDAAEPPAITCGNLIYAGSKSSRCFADAFLKDVAEHTNIRVAETFEPVRADADDLFSHPLVVMTGEGEFELTDKERTQLRRYLTRGGFMIASAGCSNAKWDQSFRTQIAKVLPDITLAPLPAEHPVYRLVYEIKPENSDKGDDSLPRLEHAVVDGTTVLVYAPDGLNDSDAAAKDCCCCGATELRQSRQLNVNLLTFALTH